MEREGLGEGRARDTKVTGRVGGSCGLNRASGAFLREQLTSDFDVPSDTFSNFSLSFPDPLCSMGRRQVGGDLARSMVPSFPPRSSRDSLCPTASANSF